MNNIRMILSLLVLAGVLNSFKKSTNNPTYSYFIRLTDDLGLYNVVYIDLHGMEITGGDGKEAAMNAKSGIHDLLHFSYRLDTLIATDGLVDAKVQPIKLILGSNNSVVVNNEICPLCTPIADQSGIKLQVHHALEAGVNYAILLDFDANESIIETGAGVNKLRPIKRNIETAISGSIIGNILPADKLSYVSASSSNSYSTNVNTNDYFVLKGTSWGSYTVTVTPTIPINSVKTNNVMLTNGATTDLDVINL